MVLEPLRAPELLPRAWIVAGNHLGAGRHELKPLRGFDDDGRAPGATGRALGTPHLLAGRLVERDDRGVGAHLLVDLKDYEILEKDR